MNLPHPCLIPKDRARTKPASGAALIVVLSMLILLTALVVAFLGVIETETQSSAAYKQQATLRQIADLSLQLVETQIHAATTLHQKGDLTEATHTWTSQPGLLRVFNRTGSLARAYKLYSATRLEEDNIEFITQSIPADWRTHPHRWTDLNAPFRSILDADRLVWPILSPEATDWASSLVIEEDPSGIAGAAMPVEWLYVLPDGTLVPYQHLPDTETPVGRIAFWTDDTTCKININTAGERTMWDRPRAFDERRERYGRNQPSTGEYNAYPGHPATVSLSAVLGKALQGDLPDQIVEKMLALSPRYRWGGSENSTRTIWNRSEEWQLGNLLNLNKNSRLFATTSEFLFTPDRSLIDRRLQHPIEHSGFLLTDSSRAPEINLLGLPRVGIWPIDTEPDKQTVYDQTIARGLTIGSKPYYFQRNQPLADHEATSIPRNEAILEYLDQVTQTPINGFGGSFEEKWGTSERRQILTMIFDYVRAATNLSDTSRNPDQYAKQFTPAFNQRRGYVVPTRIPAWNTRGLGRAPVMTHVAATFYAYEQINRASDPNGTPDYETEVHLLLWFNFFETMHGLAPYSTTYQIRINDCPFQIRGNRPNDVFQGFNWVGNTSSRFFFPRTNQMIDWGGYTGMLIHAGTVTGGFANYEFHSSAPVTIRGNQMTMNGGTLNVDLYDNESNTLLQSYTVVFPGSSSMPVPTLWGGYIPSGAADAPVRTEHFSPPNGPNPFQRMHFSQRNYANPLDPQGDPVRAQVNAQGARSLSNQIFGRRHPEKRPVDVVRTMELRDGDARLIAGLREVPSQYFVPGEGYDQAGVYLSGSLAVSPAQIAPDDRNDITQHYGRHVDVNFNPTAGTHKNIVLPKRFNGHEITSLRQIGWAGDFDNGMLGTRDGPYANKPDEGHTIEDTTTHTIPYFHTIAEGVGDGQRLQSWDPRVNGFFSPTRQTPSPVMFGSLPAGVKRTESEVNSNDIRPWETLLFSPVSQAAMVPDRNGRTGHPGALPPHDHLLLDLFTMPVVEPYAITEPFSTAGKINLNQRIIPFTYIQRETGLHAVLKNMSFSAIPHLQVPGGIRFPAPSYRSGAGTVTACHYDVDVDATLAQISEILDPDGAKGAGVFRSASEICEIPLMPQLSNGETLESFWRDRQLTGDNSREAPYNYLYPLLTTRSNTYEIHYRVQTLMPLRRRTSGPPEARFVVSGEQQGSYLIERYLDINDERFTGESPAIDSDARALNEFYKFRMLRHRRISPSF